MKEKTLNIIFLLFLVLVFLLGFYLYVFDFSVFKESMKSEINENPTDNNCPDILINKGNLLLLYNSKQPEAKGINPIEFKNLDEYISYLETEKKKGIRCPVLYLQLENDAQGNDVYRMRPGPFDQEGGLPTPLVNKENPADIIDSNRDNPPYNSGNYAGFDPLGLHIGEYTVLDQIHDSTENAPISDNPQDSNWGGVLYTESAIQSGKYADRVVTRPNYVTPKGNQYPGLYVSPN
jgi:hypothetical protein